VSRTFSKITRAKMRALLPGESITEQGITFERLAKGDGLFSINVMVDGRRIHRNVGRESDGTTRTTAEDFIAQVRREAREGRLKLPKRRKVPLTLAAAAPLYLEQLRQGAGKDVERKGQKLKVHIIPFLGDRPIGALASTLNATRSIGFPTSSRPELRAVKVHGIPARLRSTANSRSCRISSTGPSSGAGSTGLSSESASSERTTDG
jgi:hypothetical protein